jgi:MFS family permease
VIVGIIEMEGFRTTMGFPLKVNGEDDDEETANKLGLVVAILSLGCFVGAITAGQLADRFGRKWTTFWGGVTATIGAVVQASAMNLLAMYAGRFVCGIGVGTLSSIVPL